MAQVARFEALNKENYDTWKIFMEALLVKGDTWKYVNGTFVKPELKLNDAASVNSVNAWEINDAKARSDIILSISSSELKQIKGCATSHQVWIKLQGTYQSRGPARKAALLRQLTTLKMENGGNVGNTFISFSIPWILISLSGEFDNFRCAIESRDALPSLDVLRVKITEEADARSDVASGLSSNAMYAERYRRKPPKKSEGCS